MVDEGGRDKGKKKEKGRDGERERNRGTRKKERKGERADESVKMHLSFSPTCFAGRGSAGRLNTITEAALFIRGSRPASLPGQGEEERWTGRT